MFRPIEVRAEKDYQLWLRYEDGSEGTIDLSDMAGRGVFKAWSDPAVFEAVQVNESGAIEWPGGLDLCGDALYMRLTGSRPRKCFPSFAPQAWMPEISRFYGIVVKMHFDPRAIGLVTEWASLHQAELAEAWGRAEKLAPVGKIDPLP